MNDSPRNRLDISAPIVALLLILTAWGNALALAIVSGLLLVGLLVFGR